MAMFHVLSNINVLKEAYLTVTSVPEDTESICTWDFTITMQLIYPDQNGLLGVWDNYFIDLLLDSGSNRLCSVRNEDSLFLLV